MAKPSWQHCYVCTNYIEKIFDYIGRFLPGVHFELFSSVPFCDDSYIRAGASVQYLLPNSSALYHERRARQSGAQGSQTNSSRRWQLRLF